MGFHRKPNKRPPGCSEQGMTLVEVLIALTIFTVGGIAVALMLTNAIRYSATARALTEATEIAQFKMERLINAPYNDPELDPGSSPYGPLTINHYNMTWTIREDVPMAAMKTIQLNVTWKDHGREKNLAFAAIKQ